jgi:hypothetical protein
MLSGGTAREHAKIVQDIMLIAPPPFVEMGRPFSTAAPAWGGVETLPGAAADRHRAVLLSLQRFRKTISQMA